MTDQPHLFDPDRPDQARAAATGPATSAAAAESMAGDVLRDQQVLVLTALVDLHRRLHRGANAWEVQTHIFERDPMCRIERNAIASRFAELVEGGYLRHLVGQDRPGPSGRPQHVFVPERKALEWDQRRDAA